MPLRVCLLFMNSTLELTSCPGFLHSDPGHSDGDGHSSDSFESGGGHATAELWGHTPDVPAHSRFCGLVPETLWWPRFWSTWPGHPVTGLCSTAGWTVPPASVFRRPASGQDQRHFLPSHHLQAAAHRPGRVLLWGLGMDPGPGSLLVRHDPERVGEDVCQSSAHRWVRVVWGFIATSFRVEFLYFKWGCPFSTSWYDSLSS